MPPSTPVAIVVDASLCSEQTHYTTLEKLPASAARDTRGAALLLVGPQFRPRQQHSLAGAADTPALVRLA